MPVSQYGDMSQWLVTCHSTDTAGCESIPLPGGKGLSWGLIWFGLASQGIQTIQKNWEKKTDLPLGEKLLVCLQNVFIFDWEEGLFEVNRGRYVHKTKAPFPFLLREGEGEETQSKRETDTSLYIDRKEEVLDQTELSFLLLAGKACPRPIASAELWHVACWQKETWKAEDETRKSSSLQTLAAKLSNRWEILQMSFQTLFYKQQVGPWCTCR